MSDTHLFIARHGETEYNRLDKMQGRGIDEPLNDTGRKQAEALAAYVRINPVDVVVSSSLKRSRETAQPSAKALKLQLHSYAELDEMNFGIVEGKSYHEVSEYLDQVQERWISGQVGHPLEGGESPKQVFERADIRIKDVLDRYAGKRVLFVLHGRLIRILLSTWLGYGLHQMHKIEHSNGALNHLTWAKGKYSPVFLHKTDHLLEYSV